MSSERTSPLERSPAWRPAPRRSDPHGLRRHPAPHLSPFYTLALDDTHGSPALSTRSAPPVPGRLHPTGALQVEVIHRMQATESAVTLWLARPGTRTAPAPYLPGQFTTLALSIHGTTHYRSYSLCGDGSADWPWEITIKRGGLASSILCDSVAPGAILWASAPRGAFTLPSPLDPHVPLIFIAAGSGITPIYGMLRALASLPPNRRPRVQLHYAARTQAEMIFARELTWLDPRAQWLRQRRYLSAYGERLSPDRLLEAVERDGTPPQAADWYICTPEALKHTLAHALHWRRVHPARVHMEVFASPKARVRAQSTPPYVLATGGHLSAPPHPPHPPQTRLRLAESGTILDAQPGETVLETLERHGYQPSFGCRVGSCGECKLRVLAGNVIGTGGGILTPAERSAGYVLSCTVQPQGEVTLASVEPPAGENRDTTSGPRSVATQPGRHGLRALMRVGLLTATIGIFACAWQVTSPTPSHSTSPRIPGASQDNHTSAPAAYPTPTPVSPGIGH